MGKEWIPNLNIGQDYDVSYRDAMIHFDKLGKMADFFGRDMPMHLHADFAQIHLILSGHTLFHIDQNSFETNGCAAFYTPPATPHAFLTETNAPGYVVTLHTAFLQQLMDELDAYRNLNGLLMPFCIKQEQSGVSPMWDTLLSLFEILRQEWQEDALYKDCSVHATLKMILIYMLRLSGSSMSDKQHNSSEVQSFRQFSTLVEQHFLTQKPLSFYCQQLGINENRLNYLCKKVTDQSPKKILNGRILLEAKRLLAHSNKNLTEIAYTLGYMDPSYFSRFFARHTGESPSDYRKSQRQDVS